MVLLFRVLANTTVVERCSYFKCSVPGSCFVPAARHLGMQLLRGAVHFTAWLQRWQRTIGWFHASGPTVSGYFMITNLVTCLIQPNLTFHSSNSSQHSTEILTCPCIKLLAVPEPWKTHLQQRYINVICIFSLNQGQSGLAITCPEVGTSGIHRQINITFGKLRVFPSLKSYTT